ncbi:unnamed protein product [Vitrella brassicaformis CCMP3155]|uniref:Thioredoxin domain-containing protein n=1 Tax=Vitrella brassicaformis (strain CCMP3155) TaxID=1169540 RepID=A0A0G4EZI0_VITBC|nr:unnamed protein product [Vitrella brassicaformis CCMP3155]|eukprot:CEM04508.1 unnamed protein product [Vitrella brassicaformis CCMP3155]
MRPLASTISRTAICSSSSLASSRAAAACVGAHRVFSTGTHHYQCLVQKPAPGFTADTVFADNSIKKLSLADLKGKYVVLLFYPLDFTFVCPSEIIAFDKALPQFHERNAEVLGVSIDSQFCHYGWKMTPLDKGGIGSVKMPLVADVTKSISRNYGVLLDGGVALRGLFLIDKEGVVRHMLVNDLPLGRSVDECLRIIDALQYTEKHGEVCPANWTKGAPAMKASAEGVADYLSKHS